METTFKEFDGKKCFRKPSKDIDPIWNTFVQNSITNF